MKKNATFTASTIEIEVAHGKIDWYAANQDFRTAMQYRYDAAVKIADLRTQTSTEIKTLRDHINYLEKSRVHSAEDVDKDNAEIDRLTEALKSAEKEFAENAPAITDADKNLYLAYRAYVLDEEDPTSPNTYERAFYEWAVSVGVKPTAESFRYITKKIGMRKLGAKAIVKAGGEKFTGALTANSFYGVFYAVILEILKERGLLRGYKFTCDYANELAAKAAAKAAKNATK